MLGWQDMDEEEKKAYEAELQKEQQVRVTITLKMEGGQAQPKVRPPATSRGFSDKGTEHV